MALDQDRRIADKQSITSLSASTVPSETRRNRLPTITLPKGGGASRGIGEKFAANPVTGTGSMTVPIVTSPSRSGFGPQLSLSYDSGSGNGPFGFGWSLTLPAITRKTDKGLPQYRDAEESDVYLLSGAEDLVPEFKKDATGKWIIQDSKHVILDEPRTVDGVTYRVRHYRPHIEGLFARIERWTNQTNGEIHWRSISRDNITPLYGKTEESRIADPSDGKHVFSWLICESYDDHGNAIVYQYAEENDDNVVRAQANERNHVRTANRYLKRIKYGNRMPNRDTTTWQATDPAQLPNETWMFEVVFDYGEGHFSDDLVILGVRWSGFRLAPNALAREAQSDEAQGGLTFPPQAITEEVVVLRNFLPRQARLVGPSKIEFAVRAGTRMPLTAEGVLAALMGSAHLMQIFEGVVRLVAHQVVPCRFKHTQFFRVA